MTLPSLETLCTSKQTSSVLLIEICLSPACESDSSSHCIYFAPGLVTVLEVAERTVLPVAGLTAAFAVLAAGPADVRVALGAAANGLHRHINVSAIILSRV